MTTLKLLRKTLTLNNAEWGKNIFHWSLTRFRAANCLVGEKSFILEEQKKDNRELTKKEKRKGQKNP
jgi:hypothetical protein